MSPEMIRYAVIWGGSDRLDDRKGLGKYGYGLPSSCIRHWQKIFRHIKRNDKDNWYKLRIDIEEIAKRNQTT